MKLSNILKSTFIATYLLYATSSFALDLTTAKSILNNNWDYYFGNNNYKNEYTINTFNGPVNATNYVDSTTTSTEIKQPSIIDLESTNPQQDSLNFSDVGGLYMYIDPTSMDSTTFEDSIKFLTENYILTTTLLLPPEPNNRDSINTHIEKPRKREMYHLLYTPNIKSFLEEKLNKEEYLIFDKSGRNLNSLNQLKLFHDYFLVPK